MGLGDCIGGETVAVSEPNWQPLLDLAPELIGDFMWMYEVELHDDTRIHAYKHYWTRNYLHLGTDGRAYAYQHECGRFGHAYYEVYLPGLLERVLAPWWEQLQATDEETARCRAVIERARARD